MENTNTRSDMHHFIFIWVWQFNEKLTNKADPSWFCIWLMSHLKARLLTPSDRWPPSKIGEALSSGWSERDSFNSGWSLKFEGSLKSGGYQTVSLKFEWWTNQFACVIYMYKEKAAQCQNKSHLLIGPVLCSWWGIPTTSPFWSALSNFNLWSPTILESVLRGIFRIWFARRG